MPHAVVAPRNNYQISRNSFAIFISPKLNEVMDIPEGRKYEDVLMKSDP
jgi:hypothetical protein